MAITAFPAVDEADQSGLLAAGGDLEVASLLLAYSNGIFPWPHSRDMLLWFAPPLRALLFLDKFHISKSLAQEVKRTQWQIKFNQNFREVISRCAAAPNRRRQRGTWIFPEVIDAYDNLHRAGYAHSVECYEGDNLIGGVYGVSIGKMFAAESMFYTKPNASKLCLVKLVAYLRSQGCTWLDCQVINPFTASLGAEEVPRVEFMHLLKKAGSDKQPLFE